MTKYVRVKESDLPENLTKEEFVISAPNFLDEIKKCKGKAPKNGLTAASHLKELAAAVADRYLPEDFDVLYSVNVSKFRGIKIENDLQLNNVLVRMLVKNIPGIFDAYVDKHIKNRPFGCKLIYFLGDHLHTGSFNQNGIDELKPKEVKSYLGKKEKKIVSNSDDK
jgi:hypothetical protein